LQRHLVADLFWYSEVPYTFTIHSLSRVVVKFRDSKKNVLKIVLIIVNINKDENKSLISNQFSLKNDLPPPLLGELFCGGKN
jgi:hypothetical protein